MMTDSLDPYRQQWVTDNPFPQMIHDGEVDRETTQAEYDAMALDRAALLQWRDHQQQATAAAEQTQALILANQPTLDDYAEALHGSAASGGSPVAEAQAGNSPDMVNMAQLQEMVADTMNLVSGLVTALQQQGVLAAPTPQAKEE